MKKNAILVLLIGANLALLAAIILRTASEPAAYAQQAGGLAGNYLVVTGEATTDNDALYVLDIRKRRLDMLFGERGARGRLDLIAVASRDLDADFRNQEGD